MLEDQLKGEIQTLRTTLEGARSKLKEQDVLLQKLTSPPFVYATVVAMSKWLKPGQAFLGIGNVKVTTDGRLSLGLYHVGDQLGLRTKEGLREEVVKGKKFSVVGFKGDDAVIQIDDNEVVNCPADNGDFFIILKSNKNTESEETIVITIEGKLFEVLVPRSIKVVKPGDMVTVVKDTMQIINVASVQIGGSIGYLRRVIDETFSEVECESSVRVVFNGQFSGALEKGDRVVLDGTSVVIIRNLGKDDERFNFNQVTNITWDEIGGLAEAKKQMIEAVELPHRNPELFKFYNKKQIKGVLLYGPPGCGKTLLGKATATALARIYKQEVNTTGFIYIKGPEILDRFVGTGEATIRQIFQRARKHKEAYGYPSVIFIDEAEAILNKRGSGISSDVERTIVPMFLTEMDGLEDSGALVILATNRQDILDPAIVRDGRIDRKIKIGRPTKESAIDIFLLALKGVPLLNGYTHEDLAKFACEEVFSDNRLFYKIETKNDGVKSFTLGQIINGGMIVGIVDQATSIAMDRDISLGQRGGLKKDDFLRAIDLVEQQNRDLNHADALAEFCQDFQEEVASICRLCQGHE